jgi:N-methylhydantoinase B/oxoprolinase/acetone carboxylase alpha subunit
MPLVSLQSISSSRRVLKLTFHLQCVLQNGGCLAPIRVEIPDGCMLAPSKEAAVCGGNVVTSQRITDVGECDRFSFLPSLLSFADLLPFTLAPL